MIREVTVPKVALDYEIIMASKTWPITLNLKGSVLSLVKSITHLLKY